MAYADAERGDVVVGDCGGRVRRRVAAVVLDDDAVSDARHDVVDDINPRVVGDSDALAEDAEIVVNLVICDTAVGILRAALPVGVYPDGHLADVLDDVVLYNCVGVRRLRAVDAELCVNVLAVVDDAGGERGVVAVNGEAFEGDAVGVERGDDGPGEAGVNGVA